MGSEVFSLSGRTALVTGGSRGIGLAIAEGLAENGADIAILARDTGRLEQGRKQIQECSGREVRTLCFDLEDANGIEGIFSEAVKQSGRIDILVNCAGIVGREEAGEISIETWRRVIGVNLTAALLMSQAFYRHRKASGSGGRIINIGSLMCQGARPTTAAYASSKGGLLMLTRSLAIEWAKDGINVNAIGPGYVATELTEPLQSDAKFNDWVVTKTPMARWGRPEDMVGAAVFLASSASDFVTGQILYVDGGWLAAL